MNQENKYFLFTLLLFGISAIVIQSLLVPLIEINLWQPDLVLVIVLLIGKRFDSIKGSTAGFVLGIMQDSLSPLPIGITALPKAIAGFAAGKTKVMRLEGAMYYVWFVLLIFIHEMITYLFLQYKTDLTFTYMLYSRVFPNTVYTTLMLFIINLFSGKYFTE